MVRNAPVYSAEWDSFDDDVDEPTPGNEEPLSEARHVSVTAEDRIIMFVLQTHYSQPSKTTTVLYGRRRFSFSSMSD
jgi:hypothetical protein